MRRLCIFAERETGQQRRRVLGRPAMLLALFALAAGASARADPEPPIAEIGQPAPAFSVQNRDRIWQSWTDFRGGRGLVFVFATMETAEDLNVSETLKAELSERDFPILIIDITCGVDAPGTFAAYREYATDLSVRFDPKGAVASLYKVPGVPYAVAVDGDLMIRFMGGLGRNAKEAAAIADAFKAIAQGDTSTLTSVPAEGAGRFRPDCGFDG